MPRTFQTTQISTGAALFCTRWSLCIDVVDNPKNGVTIVQSCCYEVTHQCLSRLSCQLVPHFRTIPELGKGCVAKLLNVMAHAECLVDENTQVPCPSNCGHFSGAHREKVSRNVPALLRGADSHGLGLFTI